MARFGQCVAGRARRVVLDWEGCYPAHHLPILRTFYVYGGDGNDQLSGGDGRDILTGGTGRDRFGASDTAASLDRADVITDFTQGEDKLYFGWRHKLVWYRAIDTDGDGRDDVTVLYDAATNGRIYAVLENFVDDLDSGDFFGPMNSITEII